MPKNLRDADDLDHPHHYHSSLGCALSMVYRTYRARASEQLETIGLYKGQEMILYTLFHHGGVTQTELAAFMHLKPATITMTLQRLEKAGFVSRQPDPDDQRMTRVFLSDKGRDLIAHLDNAWLQLEDTSFGFLDETERQQLHSLLIKVYQNLTE